MAESLRAAAGAATEPAAYPLPGLIVGDRVEAADCAQKARQFRQRCKDVEDHRIPSWQGDMSEE